jgi:hypothetical protein
MLLCRGGDGFHESGGDELAKGGLGDAHVASDSGKPNATLGDQATRETLRCAEHFGGFSHGKQAV